MADQAADVIVVGGGNAAFCAALAAQEQGAKVRDAGSGARGRVGRQQPLHRGLGARRLQRRRRHQDAGSRPHPAGDRRDRLRHLHGRPVLRRHGAGDAEPRRSRPGRAAGHQELRHLLLAARQGHPLHPDLRPPGVQDRRQVQVLGRAHGRGGRRRPGPHQDGDRCGEQARHRHPLPDARAQPAVRRRAASRACASATTAWKATCTASRSCSPAAASRPIPNGARAISGPAGTSPRCAARASTPATASAWRSRSAPQRAATGRAATRCNGR